LDGRRKAPFSLAIAVARVKCPDFWPTHMKKFTHYLGLLVKLLVFLLGVGFRAQEQPFGSVPVLSGLCVAGAADRDAGAGIRGRRTDRCAGLDADPVQDAARSGEKTSGCRARPATDISVV